MTKKLHNIDGTRVLLKIHPQGGVVWGYRGVTSSHLEVITAEDKYAGVYTVYLQHKQRRSFTVEIVSRAQVNVVGIQ